MEKVFITNVILLFILPFFLLPPPFSCYFNGWSFNSKTRGKLTQSCALSRDARLRLCVSNCAFCNIAVTVVVAHSLRKAGCEGLKTLEQ